jgi:hypothetical protein
MDKEKAKLIIIKYNLIAGKVGRRILLAIKNNRPITPTELPQEITVEQIENLKSLYQKKAQEIGSHDHSSNFIFYNIIKDQIPEFDYKSNQKNVQMQAPRIQNLSPSLLSLLLNIINSEKDMLLPRKHTSIQKFP